MASLTRKYLVDGAIKYELDRVKRISLGLSFETSTERQLSWRRLS